MRLLYFFVLLAGLASLPGCTTVNVEQQQTGVDYSKYRTFDWAETRVKTSGQQNPLLSNPLTESTIKSTFSQASTRQTAWA